MTFMILSLFLTPHSFDSLLVFDDAINKISQLAGRYLSYTHAHTPSRCHTGSIWTSCHHVVESPLKKIPCCHSDSVEKHPTPILGDSHLTALQLLLQRWMQRRRGFITVIMGNHGDATMPMTRLCSCSLQQAQTEVYDRTAHFWVEQLTITTQLTKTLMVKVLDMKKKIYTHIYKYIYIYKHIQIHIHI